jgi:hypothetical protein
VARLFLRLASRRWLVVGIAAVAAVLEARGIGPVRAHIQGFFDGPH